MSRVVVDVMLKPEIADPQGQAITNALPSLGVAGVTAVRQGKRFELDVEGELTEAALAQVDKIAATLLANPVVEDYVVQAQSVEVTR